MKSFNTILFLCALLCGCMDMSSRELVLLHTNDTHSQIDPAADGLGGVLRRKALIDSVKTVHPNVMLIDAGDAVQGTLYFTLYGGEVEMKAMNALGYDLAVLGNHDFDNGMDALAKNLKTSESKWLSTNYDVKDTPLRELLLPYVIKEVDGKRIGFMGINLNPEGIISSRNYKGIKYLDPYKAANSTAWALRHNEGVDMVVAITHLGYEDEKLADDVKLAAQSEDIDIIIGGHTHTFINPANPSSKPWLVKNAVGKDVLVAQTGKMGKNVGEIVIDLDTMTPDYKLITVDKRFDDRLDPATCEILEPYRAKVDSMLTVRVARSAEVLDQQRLANLFGDMVLDRGRELAGKDVDFGLINNGGIRNSFPKGDVSEGNVIMTLPFDNRICVVEVPGSALRLVFDKMVERGINGVSKNVAITYDPSMKTCTEVLIDGKPLDDNKMYKIATIDYLANGGDYLVWLRDGKRLAESPNILHADMTRALRKMKGKLNPSPEPRVKIAN